ncbi:unnamed protein product [Paramecium pentaurelia]|uniref:Uncharacterized protein n=1 Tax=Paramecium pentaurelia TaxID=43138 RepID=A0A8S1TAY5_9CILI|nr:unnamed protein product [Paramecium pentaurelia]
MGCSSMKASRKGSLSIPKNGILKKPSPNQSCQLDIIVIKKKTLKKPYIRDKQSQNDRRRLYFDYILFICIVCQYNLIYMLNIGIQDQDSLQIKDIDLLKFGNLNKKYVKIYIQQEQQVNTYLLYSTNLFKIPIINEFFLQIAQFYINKMQQVINHVLKYYILNQQFFRFKLQDQFMDHTIFHFFNLVKYQYEKVLIKVGNSSYILQMLEVLFLDQQLSFNDILIKFNNNFTSQYELQKQHFMFSFINNKYSKFMSWGEPAEVNIQAQDRGNDAPQNNWGNTEQAWGNNDGQQQDVQQGQEDQQNERKGKKGKKREASPPPVKRVRPNPIVIVVDEDEDSETQNIIINECPKLQNKNKGLIQNENKQICYEGNLKIEDCVVNTRFISFDLEQQVKIDCIGEYTIENAKDLLKTLNDQVLIGIVEGLDEENQKVINKLADNLLDKQQSIKFKDLSLFSIKQLYKIENKSRLAFIKQITQ